MTIILSRTLFSIAALTATSSPKIATRIWRGDRRVGNFGDALNPILLRHFGFEAVAVGRKGTFNHGRTLLAIGSVISNWHLRRTPGQIDIWGGGWRGEAIDDRLLARMTVHAVRGPRTATALGCPIEGNDAVPMGDPALLLPRFHAPPVATSRSGTLLVPHYFERRLLDPVAVGCDVLVKPNVRQRGRWIGWRLPTPLELIDRIVASSFVLAGALHVAIIAQSYGVPWAAWAGSKIDCPAKWLDWFDYLGIEGTHVANRKEGEAWWQRHGIHGKVRPLEPLIAAFPYPCPDAEGAATFGPVGRSDAMHR